MVASSQYVDYSNNFRTISHPSNRPRNRHCVVAVTNLRSSNLSKQLSQQLAIMKNRREKFQKRQTCTSILLPYAWNIRRITIDADHMLCLWEKRSRFLIIVRFRSCELEILARLFLLIADGLKSTIQTDQRASGWKKGEYTDKPLG